MPAEKLTALKKSNFEKFPFIQMNGHECNSGWTDVTKKIEQQIGLLNKSKTIVAIECYHGVDTAEIITELLKIPGNIAVVESAYSFLSKEVINAMVHPFVTDDPVFGMMNTLSLHDFIDKEKLAAVQKQIAAAEDGIIFIVGTGAGIIAPQNDLLIYADMPRWEIQLRFRANKTGNLGSDNKSDKFSYQYKRAFFVDWRVCDRYKKEIYLSSDLILDSTMPGNPGLVNCEAISHGLKQATTQPFRVVPFFDPGPWGGQWLKEVIDLDRSVQNFAWGFDCVPEENSLLFKFGDCSFEIPSINLVFFHPKELLGEKVFEAFGTEFPIRFDFLDTMEGGNLSLQVHPLREYIREKFGMGYTQDESYYFLDAKDDAFVYLGLKENIKPEKMLQHLEQAQQGGDDFDAEQFVEKWPIKKHDHVLIPAGTIHCSGANSVVLEISATPYIFTFKLWDWGRMGLDGKPRPISLEHGKQNIQWDRTTQWTEDTIINHLEPIAEGIGWREERTGLDEGSFIETRRHWFTGTVTHYTNGVVNVVNLVEGREVIIESPVNAFEPYIIHYAETFIVPAHVGAYTIRPYGESEGQECATMKAYVRTQHLINYQLN